MIHLYTIQALVLSLSDLFEYFFDWLPIVFHFGTENREEQLKKAPCINHFEDADITNPSTGRGGPSEREVQDKKVRQIKREN